MAYKIHYGVSRHDRAEGRNPRKLWVSLILLSVILVGIYLIDVSGIRFDWLLPGDPDVTAAALEGLREDLAVGEPFVEAVTTFCWEIVNGAALD